MRNEAQMTARTPIMAGKRGYTLVVSLILLVMMSLIGATAVNVAINETKIARNFESNVIAMSWGEAGVEAARQVILTSSNPEVPGYNCSCEGSNPEVEHWYPNSLDRRVKYCIEYVKVEISADNRNNRTSGQESPRVLKTYHYKVDSCVVRPDNAGINVRQVQTIEQQTLAST